MNRPATDRPGPSGPARGVPGAGGHHGRSSGTGFAPRTTASDATLAVRRLGPVRLWAARHPRAVDVLVMAGYAVPALLQVTMSAPTTGPLLGPAQGTWSDLVLLVVAVVVLVGTTAALWWRRTRPEVALAACLVLAVVGMLVLGTSLGGDVAVAFAIYAVAANRGPRRGWTSFAVATLLIAGASAATVPLDVLVAESTPQDVATADEAPIPASPWEARIVVGSLVALLNLTALTIGNGVYNRRRHEQGIVDRLNQLALERDQREQLAVADERARIARELHDVVAHSLTVMVTLAEGAARVAPRDAERAAAVMREVATTGRTALADTRRVVGVLRADRLTGEPRSLLDLREEDAPGSDAADAEALDGRAGVAERDGAPLEPAPTRGLEDLVAQFRSAGLAVTLTRTGPDLPQDSALRLTVYRLVQEALTNVLRYAPLATSITVEVERTPDDVRLSVANTAGPGPQRPVPGSGRGLIGMRERVAVLGGTLDVGAAPGGWRVRAVLPWRDDGDGDGDRVDGSAGAPGRIEP
ncbi:two-component sensor histidine kinase [Miniimonas arenae]|uniref:histidine kinase n=1 Tax=Miniimonas arenae TaxID=676201 RepID=A0A5C5BDL5_9MICO|nr:histidine kinase [Miniimonas arenae]TNU74760.1 two-component sensor histidine kinase [Miniimonas arenae]